MNVNPTHDELVRHAAWVKNLVRGMVRDPHLAEDLAQDALEAGLRGHGQPLKNPRAWLAGVVRNLRNQELRSRERRARREEASAPHDAPPRPDEVVARAEGHRAIAAAVLELPEPYRSTLLMRYFDERSPAQIASAMGADTKAVKNRLHRGLQLLRERVKAEHGSHWTALVLPLAPISSTYAPLAEGAVSKPLLALYVVVVAVGYSVFFLDGIGPNAVPEEAAGVEATLDEAPTRPDSSSTPPSMEGGDARIVREDVPIPQDLDRGPRDIRIQVVDGVTGAPVPHAAVRIQDGAVFERCSGMPGYEFLDYPGTSIVADQGELFEADEDGWVEASITAAGVAAFSAPDDRYGGTRYYFRPPEHDQREFELKVYPDVTVEVTTVDLDGEPLAGIPVFLLANRSRMTNSFPRFAGRTRGEGKVTVRHFGSVLRTLADRLEPDTLHAYLGFPLAEDAGVPVKTVESGRMKATLAVPTFGSVVVEVRDRAGDPVPDGTVVQLQRRRTVEERQRQYLSTALFHPHQLLGIMERETQGGRARFETVGLGIEVEFATQFREGGDLVHSSAPGPVDAGEEVVVSLQQERLTPTVRGTLLDEMGDPWTAPLKGYLCIAQEGGRPFQIEFDVHPDEDGAFLAKCADAPTEQPLAARFCFSTETAGDRRVWVSELFEVLPTGVTDLGTLDLRGTLLVGGTVVLPGDGREAGCVVGEPGRNFRGSFGPPPPAHELVRTELHDQVEATTDDRGHFRIFFPRELYPDPKLRAEPPRGRGELSAVTVEFTPGETRLEVRLVPQTRIVGSVVIEKEFLRDVSVRFRPLDDPDARGVLHAIEQRLSFGRDGSFSRWIKPGRYLLVVRDEKTGHALHEGGEFDVPEGETTDIGEVDLRGMFRGCEVSAVGPDGAVVDELHLSHPDPAEGRGGFPKKSPVRIVVRELPVSVGVYADGFLYRTAEITSTEETITLERAPKIEIRLTGADRVPSGTRCNFRLTRPEGWREQNLPIVSGDLDASRVGTVYAPAPGRYEVQVSGWVDNGNGSASAYALAVQEILVEEGLSEAAFEIATSEEYLAEFLRRAGD